MLLLHLIIFHVSERIFYKNVKLIMATNDKIRDEKVQYDIARETAKISTLSLCKIDKYGYLTGEEILPSNQRQIIEQAKFANSLLVKDFEKQTEIQVGALKSQYIYNKKDKLRVYFQKNNKLRVYFQRNMLNDLIAIKLKEIIIL